MLNVREYLYLCAKTHFYVERKQKITIVFSICALPEGAVAYEWTFEQSVVTVQVVQGSVVRHLTFLKK